MPRANWHVLKSYPVLLPNPELGLKFSKIFSDLLSLQNVLMAQIHNLRRTRDLLLPRLLSGKIQLKDLDQASTSSPQPPTAPAPRSQESPQKSRKAPRAKTPA